jgi:hypothetical protein
MFPWCVHQYSACSNFLFVYLIIFVQMFVTVLNLKKIEGWGVINKVFLIMKSEMEIYFRLSYGARSTEIFSSALYWLN